MRNILMGILLTSAAMSPALAQDHGRWQHDQDSGTRDVDREQRQQAREERRESRQQDNGAGRSQAADFRQRQPQPVEQRQVVDQGQRQARQFEQRQVVDQGQRGGWDRSRFEGRANVNQQVQVQQQVEQQRAFRNGYRGGYTGTYSGRQTEQVQQAQRYGGWSGNRSGWNGQSGDYRQRQAVQNQAYDRSRSGSWNRDWRNDRRYDWRNYRNNHRSIFRLGVYFDPFGYGYRSYDIGYQLAPAYFGQRYWIDPGMYQLPYPPPGTQWVRYWNDAVLVDMYTGQVVDVIHDFFW